MEQAAAARLFYGDYGYYLDRVEREAAGGIAAEDSNTVDDSITAGHVETENIPEPAAAPDSLPKTILIKASLHRELSKQRQALIRRLEREEGDILKGLEALEAEKAALETELGRPEVYSSGEKARTVKARLDGVTAELEGKGREWEEKAAELERAKNGE
jgi:ATP-binding cassette subfamily F protein 3